MTERLWSPWRAELFTQPKVEGCLFCTLPAEGPAHDEKNLIVHRGDACYVILNKYPYSPGHLMVIPFAHGDDLKEMTAVATELFTLAEKSTAALKKVMGPHGFNLGVNLGKAAGAGIPGHGHLHVVPRWEGDANFLAVVADTRVISEGIAETWRRLKPHFP